ncbi:MAG: ParB N-terminal domain-containing protein [Bifidobacteriaceae bacterium]|nr:ParB N-terminal domain-containing protein [Bifidobacteriaceae bacterium]
MTAGPLDGAVNLEWSIDGITVGSRHRQDLGDLEELIGSIERLGLLQPVTVTPDGVLICGVRRLAALKRLGYKRVPVWVRSGLSDRLSSLMAERDENTARKDYTKTELAALYAELKKEIAADAARRQRATRFGSDPRDPSSDGAAHFAGPWRETADSRRQAAQMVGGPSHATLEKILAIQQAAQDEGRPAGLRAEARQAADRIGAGEAVDPLFNRLRSLVRVDDLERIAADLAQAGAAREAASRGAVLLRRLGDDPAMTPQDLDRAARAALARVRRAQGREPEPSRQPEPEPNRPEQPVFKTVKSFIWTWTEMADWPNQYDPAEIAGALTKDQYQRFAKTMADANQFTAELARRREQQTSAASKPTKA